MTIAILGNVGNAGYALPMVQAYPTDVNSQNLLAWDPVTQALNYVPYVGSALGDFSVVRDLNVGRNANVVGALTVVGTLTAPLQNGNTTNALGSATYTDGNVVLTNVTRGLYIGANKVVAARTTGWAAMTGTPQKTTAATGTVTLPQLAGIVMSLQADLIAHGLIGA